MTRHDDDIPRTELDCLDLRNAPDGKGPLAKAVRTKREFVITDPDTGNKEPVKRDSDGNMYADLGGGDQQLATDPVNPPNVRAFDPDTGEYSGPSMQLVVEQGQSGGRADVKLVKQLQIFLVALGGFNLGSTGPQKDGVDGDFGEKTDKAVKEFQSQHTDFNGEQLKQDGKVGPKTSDALNRAMVGLANDDDIDIQSYLTPLELTKPIALGTMIRSHVANFQAFGTDVKFGINKLVVVIVD